MYSLVSGFTAVSLVRLQCMIHCCQVTMYTFTVHVGNGVQYWNSLVQSTSVHMCVTGNLLTHPSVDQEIQDELGQ